MKFLQYSQVFSIFLLISSSQSFVNLLRIKARFISLSVVRIYVCINTDTVHLVIFDHIKIPGTKPNFYQSFSICHWNLNNNSVQNFLRLSLSLHVYQRLISIYPFYMIMITYKFQVII